MTIALIILIYQNLALGVFEEKEQKPKIISSLDTNENEEDLSDEETSSLQLPNNTRNFLNKKEDIENQAAVMNLMGALFHESDEEEEESETSSETDEVEQ